MYEPYLICDLRYNRLQCDKRRQPIASLLFLSPRIAEGQQAWQGAYLWALTREVNQLDGSRLQQDRATYCSTRHKHNYGTAVTYRS